MIGGGIGFVLGGPLGAVAGAAFGHMFDSDGGGRQRVIINESTLGPAQRGQFTFFVAAFSMLGKIAKADGRVTKPELETVRSFMTRDLGLNAQSRMVAEQIFRQSINTGQPFTGFARQFYSEFQGKPRMLEAQIDIMLRVAASDGAPHKNQDALIAEAAGIFRIPHAAYMNLRARHVQAAQSRHYSILGCSPGDSNETIKRQYRKKVKEYHPDTIAAKNLPEDFIAYAGDRFREVQEAWEAIQNERQF